MTNTTYLNYRIDGLDKRCDFGMQIIKISDNGRCTAAAAAAAAGKVLDKGGNKSPGRHERPATQCTTTDTLNSSGPRS